VLLFVQSPAEGAQTTIYLSVSEDVEGISGKYFIDCKVCIHLCAGYYDNYSLIWHACHTAVTWLNIHACLNIYGST
jgi:hypothetical protein